MHTDGISIEVRFTHYGCKSKHILHKITYNKRTVTPIDIRPASTDNDEVSDK